MGLQAHILAGGQTLNVAERGECASQLAEADPVETSLYLRPGWCRPLVGNVINPSHDDGR